MRRLLATLVLAPLVVLAALAAVYAGMVAADRLSPWRRHGPAYVLRLSLPPAGGELGLPKVLGPLDASRPLVVIDAGHGGHDPGAGAGALKEKALTLSLALALRDALLAAGGVRVALTRDDDRFLFLPERAGIARRLKADLFLSIHADSAGSDAASGATVYTLSDKGSSDEAARLAESENRADTINGVTLGGQSDAVNAILVDLSQRDTAARSVGFAQLLLREGQGQLPWRERPLQSAAFVVLKSADVPSVLFETGYISNPADAARLDSAAGRQAFAAVATRAIRAWLARQQAAGATATP